MNKFHDIFRQAQDAGHLGYRAISSYCLKQGVLPPGQRIIQKWVREHGKISPRANNVHKDPGLITSKENIDTSRFMATKIKKYQGYGKNSDGEMERIDLESVTLERRSLNIEDIEDALKSLEIKEIVLPKAQKRAGDLLIVNPSDAHVDKVNIDGLDGMKVWHKYMSDCFLDAEWREVERIIFIVGNDFFNSEFHTKATTGGTPQEINRPAHETFKLALEGWINWVVKFSEIAPVEIKIVPGNHDRNTCVYLGIALQAALKDTKVDMSHLAVEEHGKAFLAFTHGDRNEARNPERLCLALTQDPYLVKQVGKKKKYLILGHLHAQQTKDVNGWCIRTMSGLSGTDAWHRSMYYNSRACGEWMYVSQSGLMYVIPWEYD